MSMRRAFALLPAAAMTGCSFATTIRQNTAAINGSSDTIRTNTAAIGESTRGTTALVPALQGVNNLRAPLDMPMQSVAALNAPMMRVAALETPMNSVAQLDGPMRSVAAMKPSLDAV